MKLLCVLIMRSRPNLTKVISPGLLRPKHREGPSRNKGTEQVPHSAKEPSIRKYY